jgi:hypothetical protein
MGYDWYPYKKRERDSETETQEKHYIKTEAEIGVMCLPS